MIPRNRGMKCACCGRVRGLWFNDVPLRAFCWGKKKSPHKEWSKQVLAKFNPYIRKL